VGCGVCILPRRAHTVSAPGRRLLIVVALPLGHRGSAFECGVIVTYLGSFLGHSSSIEEGLGRRTYDCFRTSVRVGH
jgi:hypothetical protein